MLTPNLGKLIWQTLSLMFSWHSKWWWEKILENSRSCDLEISQKGVYCHFKLLNQGRIQQSLGFGGCHFPYERLKVQEMFYFAISIFTIFWYGLLPQSCRDWHWLTPLPHPALKNPGDSKVTRSAVCQGLLFMLSPEIGLSKCMKKC